MHAYRKRNGSWPTDIRDAQGRALLSWRVRLLPYIESHDAYERFHLAEPWDSPHNRQLLAGIPRLYRCPASRSDAALTSYLRLIGAAKVLLVEVDDEHAIEWSRPGDLHLDPMALATGLSRSHFPDFWDRCGGFVVFLDGKTRLIPNGSKPEVLKVFLANDNEELGSLELPWYQALFTWPMACILWPWFVIALSASAGAFLVLARLLRRLPVSPGEMLVLILGASQLTHLAAVVTCYRYEQLPTFRPDPWFAYWFLPSLTATLAVLVAALKYCAATRWRTLFTISVLLFAVYDLDALYHHQHRSPDESFITASSPVLLACLAVAIIAVSFRDRSAWRTRAWHTGQVSSWACCPLCTSWRAFALGWFTHGSYSFAIGIEECSSSGRNSPAHLP